MGQQDHQAALLDGMGCTVCDEHVPAERIRLLARRDDLLFLQIDCPACGSTSLGFLGEAPITPEAERLADGPPVSSDDVLDMHAFLASWTGDLDGLVRPAPTIRERQLGPGGRRPGRSA